MGILNKVADLFRQFVHPTPPPSSKKTEEKVEDVLLSFLLQGVQQKSARSIQEAINEVPLRDRVSVLQNIVGIRDRVAVSALYGPLLQVLAKLPEIDRGQFLGRHVRDFSSWKEALDYLPMAIEHFPERDRCILCPKTIEKLLSLKEPSLMGAWAVQLGGMDAQERLNALEVAVPASAAIVNAPISYDDFTLRVHEKWSDRALLGFTETETLSERQITTRYRQLSSLVHPDKNKAREQEAKALFQRLQDAYDQLKKNL